MKVRIQCAAACKIRLPNTPDLVNILSPTSTGTPHLVAWFAADS